MKTFTPDNPSAHAIRRVPHPTPVPERCTYCTGRVVVANNSTIYGRPFGNYPWVLKCIDCDSYVGLHPDTNIPLGTMANKETREARKEAKKIFYTFLHDEKMSRTAGYKWLADQMGLTDAECHFGLFTVEQCEQVMEILG